MGIKVDNDTIEQLVSSALKNPALDRYGEARKDNNGQPVTTTEDKVDKMIRDAIDEAAKDATKEWMAEQRPKVKAMVRRKLGAKSKGLIGQLVNKLVIGLVCELKQHLEGSEGPGG